jgi:hypothetical protein
MLRSVVWQKFTNVSEQCTAAFFRVEEKAKQATSNKQAADRPHYRFGGVYCLHLH